jgi:hypothetical protein
VGLDRVSTTRLCWLSTQQATIIIVSNAPVEERIGSRNTLKSNIQKLSVLR